MINKPKIKKHESEKQTLAWTLCVPACLVAAPLSAVNPDGTAIVQTQGVTVTGAALLNPTTVEVLFSDGQRMTLDFMGKILSACSRIRIGGNYP